MLLYALVPYFVDAAAVWGPCKPIHGTLPGPTISLSYQDLQVKLVPLLRDTLVKDHSLCNTSFTGYDRTHLTY